MGGASDSMFRFMNKPFEKDFISLLLLCHSYEEFMMRKDIEQIDFNAKRLKHLGFESKDSFDRFLKYYYNNVK